ncbi:MAG: DNA repair protein RecN [Nitrosomonas sp.]|nr:MAG: DNA repair protein RecN [Nitrosomonas sp.]
MLKQLGIKDFVIVDFIELEFESGFTVLTGETGAGKSIIIDALSLALGERGDVKQIRHGCDRAEVSVLIELYDVPALSRWLSENDLSGDPENCLVRRVLEANGRSRNYVNGHPVTLQQLRYAGDFWVVVHSQHAHQSLLHKEVQRDLLDAVAGCTDTVWATGKAFQHWQVCRQQRMSAEQRTAESRDIREQLEWQLQELTELNFTLDEWQVLQSDQRRLSHVAALLAAAEDGLGVLSENELSILSQLNTAIGQLQNLLDYDAQLKSIIDLLDSARIQVREGVYELKHYSQHLDLDPQLLAQAEQRISAIHAVARKFRTPPEELPALIASLQQQLGALGCDADIDRLLVLEATAESEYMEHARLLTQFRSEAAETLSRQVSDAMHTLAMTGGVFSVDLCVQQQGAAYGFEQVEFMVSAHQGMPLRPLAKVVSGGELSRISLAIQVITSKVAAVPTLIFDEVDVGIGGKVAEIVGRLLKRLGKERQVLCITHLPQVAANGDHHWQVAKFNEGPENQPVLSKITCLNQSQRIEEIARMLGGIDITATTRQHAVEMLHNGTLKD